MSLSGDTRPIGASSYAPQSFMGSLDAGARSALLELGHRRTWQRGDLLFHTGERATSAVVLTAGALKIHKVTPDGTEVVLALLGPGDLLGEISAVEDSLRSASATALDSGHGLVIPVPDLRRFLSTHPGAMMRLLGLTVARLHIADERRLEFATAESLARVASRLVELAERFGERLADGVIDIALPINQGELASWSASSRESTARALHTLRGLGVIETHRMHMKVLDLEKLRSHSARL